MALGFIEYAIMRNWIITQNNRVGPTTNTTIRPNSLLPWKDARSTGAPDYDTINKDNDANTIYLDPDGGNDANTGTDLSSDAVKTFARALVLITVTRHTIHIERTDSETHSDLSETLSGATAITSDLSAIQVASGQTAKLTILNGWYEELATSFIININGLELVGTHVSVPPIFGGGLTISGRWHTIVSPSFVAELEATSTDKNQDCMYVSTGANNTDLLPGNSASPEATLTTSGPFIHNCIVVNEGTVKRGLTFGGVALVNLDYEHVTIANYEKAMSVLSAAALSITNFHSFIIHNCGELIEKLPTSNDYSFPLTNSLINTNTDGMADTSDSSNVKNQDPLFRDVGLRDYRLAHEGVEVTPGVFYPLSSPAVGIGLSDAGAFDFDYTRLADSKETFTFPDDYAPEVRFVPERLNYQGFKNIEGNFFNTWDSVNYYIEMTLAGQYWTGQDFSTEFVKMLRSKGTKRYFQHGNVGIFNVLKSCSLIGTDIIDFTTNLDRDMPDDFYIGWIAKVESDTAKLLSSFATSVFDAGALDPKGVSLSTDGTLWVCDSTANRIYNIETDGTLIIAFPTSNYDAFALDPTGISYASDGTLWVCDSTTNKIYNIETDGTLISSFLTSIFDAGATTIQDISSAVDGTLWVVDSDTDKVYNIQTDGTLISSFLTSVFDVDATTTTGISSSADGTLWVCDSDEDKIYHINEDGTLISSFPTSDFDAGAIRIHGISFDASTDSLWLSDTASDKIYNVVPANQAGYFEITDNTETKLTVEYIRGIDVFTISLTSPKCSIVYLPVLFDMESMDLVSEYYSEDEGSGTVFKSWYKTSETDVASEFHTRSLILRQTKEEGTI